MANRSISPLHITHTCWFLTLGMQYHLHNLKQDLPFDIS